MTITNVAPRFNVWLGDGWPGLFVVEARDAQNHVIVTATVRADDLGEAGQKAAAAFPEIHGGQVLSVRSAYEITDQGTVVPEFRR